MERGWPRRTVGRCRWAIPPLPRRSLPPPPAMHTAPSALPPGACAETGFAGVHALMVRPPGLPVSSLRVCVPWDVGEYVWERLLQTGQGAVMPLGLEGLRELLRPSG